jgi:hypothetical protein
MISRRRRVDVEGEIQSQFSTREEQLSTYNGTPVPLFEAAQKKLDPPPR